MGAPDATMVGEGGCAACDAAAPDAMGSVPDASNGDASAVDASNGDASAVDASNGDASAVDASAVDAGPTVIDDCAGTAALASGTVALLEAGATADAAMQWLYPYDQTVFPQGIPAPVLQWTPQSSGPPAGIYLHLKSQRFEYKGCFGASAAARLTIPTAAWARRSRRARAPRTRSASS